MTGELPTQPSLRRLRQFGVRPKRDLGQNFLIDSNILGVIERAAELGPADVVLEIGGGLGVLSEHLAPRCAHVHVVELDRALVPALEDALAPHPNTTLHVADARSRVDDGNVTLTRYEDLLSDLDGQMRSIASETFEGPFAIKAAAFSLTQVLSEREPIERAP